MSDQYILDDKGSPIPEEDLFKWAKWMQETNLRKVAVNTTSSGVRISTVFLGLDHSFGEGEPILWETMIFGGPHDQYQERYTSLAAAVEGHNQAVELAMKAEGKEPQ
jgi:hypothetical protein